jgi:hypothetical protein
MSSINQAARWFAELAHKRVRRGVFRSVRERWRWRKEKIAV